MNTTEYKVELDNYNGPIDLLLYLIKREEVDIYDIPIAKVTDQYMAHMELLKALEPAVVGDFMVMAATLMQIKSQILLPQTTEEKEDDPRWELVRQLLEYKKFKEAASALDGMREARAMKTARAHKTRIGPAPEEEGEHLNLEDMGPWELLGFFKRLMRETLQDVPTTITIEETPIEEFMGVILERLGVVESFGFLDLFPRIKDRLEVIGAFLAILELMRLMKIRVQQTHDASDIHITRGQRFAAPDHELYMELKA
ncbi:MAG: segregation/condensation protein A [Candidatus Brocadiales bacterium]|nr:segregation/condensation protein A [Candidatus Bathyanammoxibius amoris]